jgi:hypothetical protein
MVLPWSGAVGSSAICCDDIARPEGKRKTKKAIASGVDSGHVFGFSSIQCTIAQNMSVCYFGFLSMRNGRNHDHGSYQWYCKAEDGSQFLITTEREPPLWLPPRNNLSAFCHRDAPSDVLLQGPNSCLVSLDAAA